MIEIDRTNLKKIMEDYEFNPDIMCEDDDKVRNAKYALSKLPESDRIIFILQTDIQSQRKVGKLLGVSHTAIGKEYNRIKNNLINIMNNDID